MLPALTAAFLTGLLFGSLAPYLPLALSAGLMVLALGVWCCERAGLLASTQGNGLLASLFCGIIYWVLVVPPPASPDRLQSDHDRSMSTVTGRVIAPVQHGPGRMVAQVRVETGAAGEGVTAKPEVVRLTWREPDAPVYCGDRVEVHARFHAPSGSLNPGGFDYAAYLERQGIRAVATVTGAGALRLLPSEDAAWKWLVWGQIDRWRSRIREAATRTLSQPALGLFLGITIGDRGYLQEDLQEWFMATGTVHLLSISGSHLGLIALLVFVLVKRICLSLPTDALLAMSRTITPTRMAVLFAWPTVALYALLAGAELATIRSLIMITIALAVVWWGYERRLYHALAVAALLIVTQDPRAIFDVAFQLSFLSMVALVHLIERPALRGAEAEEHPDTILQTMTTWGKDALMMSGAVTLATFPVVAASFNQVPWMGIMTNAFAIPFTGLLLVPIGLLAAGGTVVMGWEQLPLGSLQERLIGWMTEALHWCAGIPMSEWRVAAPSWPSIGVFYLALGLVSTRRVPRLVRGCGVVIVVVLLGWWIWSVRLGVDGERWRVTFLDVGQGDSAVVELPDGRVVLIDGGAHYERFDMGRAVVGPFLWNRGIRRIDDIIGTHQQLDHVGGLAWVLRHFTVGNYWGTGVERQEQFVAELQEALHERQLEERIAVHGDQLMGGSPCRFLIVNPQHARDPAAAAQPYQGTYLNNHSVVSRLECGGHSVLFAADIEIEGLRELTEEGRRPVTVLKVPHHGARHSLDRDWIRAIRPQHAVISVGGQNSYGHPAQSVLDAFTEEGIPVYRTDRDGAVWVTGTLSSPMIHLHRMRDRLLHPTDPGVDLWRDELANWRRIGLRLMDG
jgi:competence protein ComEC